MPAVVHVSQPGRASRLVCPEHALEEPYPRTAPAQAAARAHNDQHHPTEPKET